MQVSCTVVKYDVIYKIQQKGSVIKEELNYMFDFLFVEASTGSLRVYQILVALLKSSDNIIYVVCNVIVPKIVLYHS